MTDQKSNTSATSSTNTESTSGETEARSPRKIHQVKSEELKSRTFRIPSHCETVLQVKNTVHMKSIDI